MRIRIQPLFYLYFISMAFLTSWQTTVGAVTALFVHELGHLAVCRFFGEPISLLELTPMGGIMTSSKVPSKGIRGICIAIAGPAANYLMLMLIGALPGLFECSLRKAMVSSNAAMLCINLLPAFPLDGGRILFCLGYYVFPVVRLIEILSKAGIAAGLGFIILSLYGIKALGRLNCSVLIVGLYLVYSARKCRLQMMTENLYAIIQERSDEQQPVQPIRLYAVSEDTKLIHLLPLLGKTFLCEFVCTDDNNEYRVSEKMLCRKLLEQPFLSIKEGFDL